MNWMAWTAETAIFFASIGIALLLMTCWELLRPTELARGFLPMATTRGDRFFISLIYNSLGLLEASGLESLSGIGQRGKYKLTISRPSFSSFWSTIINRSLSSTRALLSNFTSLSLIAAA